MGWKLINRPQTVQVTKEIAQEFANMDPAPHDRPLSERRLQVYEKLLNQGEFRPVTWAFANCVETGGKYRVNGKHTSIMLSSLDEIPSFFATIEEYVCPTLEDVAKLYSTFDSSMQSRSASDIYLSFAATCPEIRDVPCRTLQSAVAGLAYIILGADYGRRQIPERAELLLEHSDFVNWFNSLVSTDGSYKTGDNASKVKNFHLVRQPTASAMFVTWQKTRDAIKFWTAVRDETDSDPNEPTRKLARYLVLTGLRSGSRQEIKRRVGTVREIFVKCLHAWNAWREGRTTSLQYYEDKDIPKVK